MIGRVVPLPYRRQGSVLRTVPERGWFADLVDQASKSGEEITAALELARTYGTLLPLPGGGDTDRRFTVLSALGQVNLTVARVFEAHTDALAILGEAGLYDETARDATFGVFAAEGPGKPLRAEPDASGDCFRLTGIKSWCSLGSRLDAGLVTAHVAGGRRLFRVDLNDPSVTAEPTSGWVARGLSTVTSTSLRFEATPGRPIGDLDWYLTRPGFSWGGIGVAACWYGGALGLQDTVRAANGFGSGPQQTLWAAKGSGPQESVQAENGPTLEPLAALALGRIDAALHSARSVLAQAAALIDAGQAGGAAGELLALRARAVVADAAEQILQQAGHLLGPAPLAFDEDHARRVADLTLYIRQHHGERDLAALGRAASRDEQ